MISATALATAALLTGCATRVVYTPAPPPPVVVSQPPPVPTAPPAPASSPAPSAEDQSAPTAAAPQPAPPPAPQPSAPTAPPSVSYAPDYYVWDGYEYVGVYGDQYVYWTGGAWIVCDPVIVARFHGWERYHPGWRRGPVYHYYYRGRGHWR